MNYDITREANYRPLSAADAPGTCYETTPEALRRRQAQQQAAIQRLFLTRQITYQEYTAALALGNDLDTELEQLRELVAARVEPQQGA
jgi:hypothetical protein